ncbi:MAG: nucleoside triphosphate pyrophosphohydrolase [Thermodesulfovibrionales bacterium]|nr:nucleoside triphosphate pyrophosphohydrolase [Thermodesulfovibrionales bacterium]
MELEELLRIMDSLRERCPWDAKQTRESLKPFLLEECYEVIEAIDEGEPEKIKEELGDLLFQIVFHCRIARERGEFEMPDVIEKISSKMIARHPHVFGEAEYRSEEEFRAHWEEQKKAEGKQRESILEGVPKTLPSLLRAHRLQDRAARAGFDWEKVEDASEKLDEEIREFKEALKEGSRAGIEDELGDIFFMLVNISRFIGVNPEDALRKTISKFISRFRHIEITAAERGLRLKDMTLGEMDALWDEAKEKG